MQTTRRRLLRATAASSLGLAAGCLGSEDPQHPVDEPVSDWPSFRGDPANTGFAGNMHGVAEEPTVEWTGETEGGLWSSPIVANGRVYIGSTDHHVYAFDADDGERIWNFETGGRVEATPCLGEDILCVGSYDRHLYGLDPETGGLLWEHETEKLIRGSPTIVDGTVFCGAGCYNLACEWFADDAGVSETGWILAVDAETGELDWRQPVDDEVVSTPAVLDGTVYTGASNGTVYARNATSGDLEWSYDTGEMIWASPAVAFDTVFVADWDGFVHAIDASTGGEEWVYNTGGDYVSGSPAVDEERVYIGMTPENHFGEPDLDFAEMHAIDRTSGEEVWSFETDALEIGSSALVTDSRVYVGAHAPSETDGIGMYTFSRDGTLEWFFHVGARGVGSSPAMVDDVLYFGGTDGLVYALS